MTANQPGALAVRLYGKRIGVITRLAGDRHLFAFDEAYVNDDNRPTLSLSFKSRSGGLVTSVRPYNIRLPPFFSNLLPEGPLREYLAARAGVKPEREFFLLATLGADLPGAITVTAVDAADDDDHHGVGVDRRDDARAAPLRFSLAGVQLKFSAIMEASGGLTIPADGIGGSWIVKLPAARFEGVPENEFVMMELARSIGIPVPEVRLVRIREIDGLPQDAGKMKGHALTVARFDRKLDGGRVHMEDFAQVFGVFPDDKYQKRSYANIAQVLAAEAGADTASDFVSRLVFSVLIGNGDMHLKNWSLLYPDGRRPVLAPAYDYVSTIAYLPTDQLALGLGGSRRIDIITREQIGRFADTASLPFSSMWDVVEGTVHQTLAAWKKLAAKEAMAKALRDATEKHMQHVAASIK
ncbi:MAG: HipA domain-containing protein [Betaproteobacteria bacterium]|nr:HipA domain-containing protein [Betaproteobacteria bacterium]